MQTPLNTAAVTDVGSRLGITAREMPATVEVISQQTMQDLGIRTTTDVAKAAVGVTGGDAPGAPAIFSMRGFSGDQINTLYNGIPIGPSDMTGRPMDTADLEQVEIMKGPASLVSGDGATGGAINYVNKSPHTGPIVNDAFTSYDSFNGYRAGYGSGGSTLINGLDYRFDISHSNNKGFIDDTYSKLSNVSGQLNYRVNDNLKIWGAAEYKQDNDRFYWGTPLVPANAPGIVPTNGIVSGPWSNYYPQRRHRHAGPGHHRCSHADHELQRARQSQRRQRALAAQRLSVGHHQQYLAEEPGLRLRRPPALVQQRDLVVRHRPSAISQARRASIASAWRSITRSGSTATSPTSPSTPTSAEWTIASSPPSRRAAAVQRLAGHAVLQ